MQRPRGSIIAAYDQTVTCPNAKCRLTFPNHQALMKHQATAPNHISCDICGINFHTQAGRKRHHEQMHPAEQNLSCPRCKDKFIRLGGLMSHVELTECSSIARTKEYYDMLQRAASSNGILPDEFKRALRALENGFDHIVTVPAGLLSGGPVPTAKPVAPAPVSSTPSIFPPYVPAPAMVVAPIPEPAFDPDEDLMSFDTPDAILNAPWGARPNAKPKVVSQVPLVAKAAVDITAASVAKKTPAQEQLAALSIKSKVEVKVKSKDETDHFPPLVPKLGMAWPKSSVQSFPTTFMDAASPWETIPKPPTDNLAPIAPPPEIKQVDSSTVVPETFDYEDPDQPSFKAAKYYNQFSQMYKCPYPRCTKSQKSPSAFIAHLKSAAHRNEKLQCHSCLRRFNTATALTQHCESQGVRCTVRHTSSYDKTVEAITYGTATVVGRHEDNTVKYGINPAVFDQFKYASPAEALIAKNQAIHAQRLAQSKQAAAWAALPDVRITQDDNGW